MTSSELRPARRVYRGIWRGIVQWMRVPDEPPRLPETGDDLVESLRPDTGFLRYLKFWFWWLAAILDGALIIAWIVLLVLEWWVGLALLIPVALIVIVPAAVFYIAIHLRYDTTWYVLSDRSLRIRRGIWIIREMTVTFENVQNIKVTQGPVQRLFGISDLHVETAGGGSGDHGNAGSGGNRAVIEGVANATDLRDRMLARLRRARGAGLGDDEVPATAWNAHHVAALREILDAIRPLRRGVS